MPNTTHNRIKMKKLGYIGLFTFLFIQACGQETNQRQTVNQDTLTEYTHETTKKYSGIINPDGQTLETRILTPEGFERTNQDENSFAKFLRQLPLKPRGSEVIFYNVSSNYSQKIKIECENERYLCISLLYRILSAKLQKELKKEKSARNFHLIYLKIEKDENNCFIDNYIDCPECDI
ncbi:hypothetical protein ES705_12988 [subsurface metagenome]